MKHFKSLAAVGIVAVFAPLSANALTFSVLDSSSNLSANTAGDFAPEYGAFLPGGATWGVAPNTVTPPPGSSNGAFLSPWANAAGTDLEETNSFFNVQPISTEDVVNSNDPAKLNLGSLKTVFTFLWGSIDVENTITFLRNGGNERSVTGSQVVGATSRGAPDAVVAGCEGALINNSYGCVAEVRFTDELGFDEIHFRAGTDTDTERNSFEFAMVPLPAAAWLLMFVSGGLIAAKRRSARRAV